MAHELDFTHLTFDCYGTLIDWETGLLNALLPLASQFGGGRPASEEAILECFVRHEARLEAPPWRPYRAVLTDVLAAIAADLGWRLPAELNPTLADSLPDWPPFSDTVPALRRLHGRFKLAIVSNVDDALFESTARRLEVPFDAVITAEQVRGYKPGPAHFHEALRRLAVPVDRILHVAQSLYHDHIPAARLGFLTAWIQRPSRLPNTGLAPAADARPDIVATSLAELAEALGGPPEKTFERISGEHCQTYYYAYQCSEEAPENAEN